MALFCDFENVALGVRDANYEKLDIRLVLEKLLLKGSIVIKKAYCDWDRYKGFKASMHEANFELIEIPHVRQSGKNSADIRLVVDALDLCYTKSHLDTFVIISGDSDFSPLVSKLRENAKYVIGVGVKQSTSDLLIANCDEFIFYDDLVRETQRSAARRDARDNGAPRRSPEDERRRKEEIEARRSKAIELATETFDALVAERGDSGKIWASALKDAIKRRKPDFNESYYGFRAFGNLLEEARARGLLEIGRDEKSGTFVYRSAGVGEGAGGESETQTARMDGRQDARGEATREGQREGSRDVQRDGSREGQREGSREGQRSRGRGRGDRGRRSAGQADSFTPQPSTSDTGVGTDAEFAAHGAAIDPAAQGAATEFFAHDATTGFAGQEARMQPAGAPADAELFIEASPFTQEAETKTNRRRHPVPARAAKKAAQDAARQSASGDPFASSPFRNDAPWDNAPSTVATDNGASGAQASDAQPSSAQARDAQTTGGRAGGARRSSGQASNAQSSNPQASDAQRSGASAVEAGEDQSPAAKTSSSRRGASRRTPAAKKAADNAADSASIDTAGTDAAPVDDAVGGRGTGRGTGGAAANRRPARKSTSASAASAAADQASTSDAAAPSEDAPAATKRAPRKTATRTRRPRKDDAA